MQPIDTIRPDVFAARTVLSVDFFYFTALKSAEINFSFFLGEQIVALRSAIFNSPDLPLGFG